MVPAKQETLANHVYLNAYLGLSTIKACNFASQVSFLRISHTYELDIHAHRLTVCDNS